MFDAIRSGLREAGGAVDSASSASFAGVTPVGMFRVRRKATISATVREVLDAVLTDEPVIGLNGIKLHRPKQIQILMSDLRKWEFTPDFPVDAGVLGVQIDVSIRSIEIVRDEETKHPALLITTASSMKPDVMIVCDVDEVVDPSDTAAARVSRNTARFIDMHNVPQKHRATITEAVGVAWGRGIAQRCMAAELPEVGAVGIDEAEAVAEMIVKDLVHQKVVGAGLFFWMQLGYWLVRIIAALIQADRAAR